METSHLQCLISMHIHRISKYNDKYNIQRVAIATLLINLHQETQKLMEINMALTVCHGLGR